MKLVRCLKRGNRFDFRISLVDSAVAIDYAGAQGPPRLEGPLVASRVCFSIFFLLVLYTTHALHKGPQKPCYATGN